MHMEALRLELFQEMACYKKPFAFKVGETYPLPPYSTVKGMLHALLGATEYVPMRLSIQGSYETKFADYQRHYFFKATDVSEFPLVMDGLNLAVSWKHMTTMPIYVHLLLNVKLVIHVSASGSVLDALTDGIRRGVPISLGRWEDLVRIDHVERVHLRPAAQDITSPYDMYLPLQADVEDMDYIRGIPFRLNWKYEIRHGVRQWQRIPVRYISSGTVLYGGDVWQDEQYPVIFAPEMEEA